jgi:hypothetical protein
MVLKRVSSLCSTAHEGSQMETEMDSTVLTYTVVSISVLIAPYDTGRAYFCIP